MPTVHEQTGRGFLKFRIYWYIMPPPNWVNSTFLKKNAAHGFRALVRRCGEGVI